MLNTHTFTGDRYNYSIMKKLFFILTAVFVAVGVSAQTRLDNRKGDQYVLEKVEYQESSARNLEPQQTMVVAPLVADIKVFADKINYTETEAFKNYEVTLDVKSDMPVLKSIALSNAAKKYGADIIVAATVDVITNADGFIEITVYGYPAMYTNFRNATADDIGLAKMACDAIRVDNSAVLANPLNTMTVIEEE